MDVPLNDPSLLEERTHNLAVHAHEAYSTNAHVDVGIVEPLADEILARRMLREHGAIRINCGGREYRSPQGVVWDRDRFFTGGYMDLSHFVPGGGFGGPVDRTEDDPLYQTERIVNRGAYSPLYRIPVPRGSYAVTLHFVHSQRGVANPGGRVFHVELEGNTVLADYDVFDSVGRWTADAHTFRVAVDDGALDMGLEHLRQNPSVSAIEIVPVGGE
ncbi:MAG: hypothetical protein GWO24_22605 [Akkermansiaceae bacterium]|nr:hypothetical protein [Akkermansiaceae bacterium]